MQKALGVSIPARERTKEEAEEQSGGKGGEKNAIACVFSFIFPFVLLISAGPSGHKRNV